MSNLVEAMPPFDLVLDALLYLVAPAAVTAAVLLLIFDRIGGAKLASCGAALGLAAGTLLGLASREAIQRLNAGELWSPWWRGALTLTSADTTWNWLPWAMVGVLAIGIVTSWPSKARSISWFVRAACVVAAVAWILPPAVRVEYWWLLPSFAAVVLCEWVIVEHVAQNPPGGTAWLCLALAGFVAGGVLLYAASSRSSEAAIITGAALGGLTLIAWWRRIDAGAAAPGAILFLCGLLLAAQLEKSSDNEIAWFVFALPAAAPLMLAFSLPFSHWPVFRLQLLRVALVLLPLAAAVILARLQAGPLEFE